MLCPRVILMVGLAAAAIWGQDLQPPAPAGGQTDARLLPHSLTVLKLVDWPADESAPAPEGRALPTPSSPSLPPAAIAPAQPRTFEYPEDFTREVAIFLHKRVGIWTISDAYMIFGSPARRRDQILGFPDPTRHYRELELDFDPKTGLLQSVYVYPIDLTWQECRRLWGSNVLAAQANKGRTFYSYQNRRLDVLVAPGGRVISLGLY